MAENKSPRYVYCVNTLTGKREKVYPNNRVCNYLDSERKAEMKRLERENANPKKSLDEMEEKGRGVVTSETTHDIVEKNDLLDLLHKTKRMLSDYERELIDALYSDEDEVSMRQFAKDIGRPKSTVSEHHHAVIEKLRNLMGIEKL